MTSNGNAIIGNLLVAELFESSLYNTKHVLMQWWLKVLNPRSQLNSDSVQMEPNGP